MKKIYLLLTIILFLTAKSDAQSWTTVGTSNNLGNTTNGVNAIAVSPLDGSVYAGGTFTGSVNYLAKYNPGSNSWQTIGSGINGPVYSLTFFQGQLIIGGLFSTAGGVTVSNIAALTSAGVFSSVGSGFNGQVNCLYTSTDASTLYAGGQFTLSGATSTLHISQWLGSTWTAIGSGISPVVNTITQHGSKLYAGTEDLSAGVYVYGTSTWSQVTGLSGGKIRALASFNNYLYAGGDFDLPTRALARYNGSSWSTAVTAFPFGSKIYSMYQLGTALYVGGNFTNLGIPGYTASYIGKFEGVNPLKEVYAVNDPTGIPLCISSYQGYVYSGGLFSSSGANVIKSSTTISIDEINDLVESSTLFPNPMSTSSTLNVKLKKHASTAHLSIIDAQGKLVQEKEISEMNNNEINFTVNRNEMAAGMYYYRLDIDGAAVSSHPFVIE